MTNQTTPPPAQPPSAGRASEDGYRSSDPAVMRALAHPLRIELLELLGDVEEATASELAEKLGQTVANCSFHLRILAAGGFIERAEPRGREKPWRTSHDSRDLRPDLDDPASVMESIELGRLVVQREAARVIRFLHDAPGLSDIHPKWVQAVSISTSTFWATAEEMAELTQQVNELTDRFMDRKDPANRPDGAHKGRLFATVNPEIDDAAHDEVPATES